MSLAESGIDAAAIDTQLAEVTFRDRKAEVELRFDRLDVATVARAEAAGLEVTGAYLDVGFLTGRIDATSLGALVSLEGLATIHPLYGAITAAGRVENQADVSMRTAAARDPREMGALEHLEVIQGGLDRAPARRIRGQVGGNVHWYDSGTTSYGARRLG